MHDAAVGASFRRPVAHNDAKRASDVRSASSAGGSIAGSGWFAQNAHGPTATSTSTYHGPGPMFNTDVYSSDCRRVCRSCLTTEELQHNGTDTAVTPTAMMSGMTATYQDEMAKSSFYYRQHPRRAQTPPPSLGSMPPTHPVEVSPPSTENEFKGAPRDGFDVESNIGVPKRRRPKTAARDGTTAANVGQSPHRAALNNWASHVGTGWNAGGVGVYASSPGSSEEAQV